MSMFPSTLVIQRDPTIKFMCLSEWFRVNLSPSYASFSPVGQLYSHYTTWVSNSQIWTEEALLTLPVFSKQLSVLLHANNWKYARVKRDRVRGYYRILLGADEVPSGDKDTNHTKTTQHG